MPSRSSQGDVNVPWEQAISVRPSSDGGDGGGDSDGIVGYEQFST